MTRAMDAERRQQDDIPLEPLLVRHVEPPPPRVRILIVSALGVVTISGVAATLALPFFLVFSMPSRWLEPSVHIHESIALPAAAQELPRVHGPELPPLPPGADFTFVVTAGERHFVILESIPTLDPWSEEGQKARAEDKSKRSYEGLELLGNREYPDGAVRTGTYDQLPETVAGWLGRTLTIDNNCQVEVHDIVELSLLTGSPDYAPGTGDDASERAMLDYTIDHGSRYYAAEIETCPGGQWARLSSLPLAHPAVDAGKAPAKLAAQAKRDFLRTKASKDAQKRWSDTGYKGSWSQSDEGSIEVRYVIHPKTGERWLLLQAFADYSCGGSEINIIGVYKQDGDKVLRHHVGDAGALITASSLVDVDGDGLFEILGHAYLSGPALANDRGKITRTVDIPFFGCPC